MQLRASEQDHMCETKIYFLKRIPVYLIAHVMNLFIEGLFAKI